MYFGYCDGLFFFFFSSRRRHTRWPRDWSSDVCSSDLDLQGEYETDPAQTGGVVLQHGLTAYVPVIFGCNEVCSSRSEERRVGKECRSRWSRYREKKKE